MPQFWAWWWPVLCYIYFKIYSGEITRYRLSQPCTLNCEYRAGTLRIRIQYSSPILLYRNYYDRSRNRPTGRRSRPGETDVYSYFIIYSDVILHLVSSCIASHQRILTNGIRLTSLAISTRRAIDAPFKNPASESWNPLWQPHNITLLLA